MTHDSNFVHVEITSAFMHIFIPHENTHRAYIRGRTGFKILMKLEVDLKNEMHIGDELSFSLS